MSYAIPQTLEDARTLGNIRFHEWNEETIQATKDLLESGEPLDDIHPRHPFYKRLHELGAKYDDIRIPRAVEKIAQALSR
jgi:hypothetical protein